MELQASIRLVHRNVYLPNASEQERMMTKDTLVGSIEGRLIDDQGIGLQIQVDDDEDNWEDAISWFVNNLPDTGTYIRVVIMSFPEV